jgi:hypothetical protein
MDIDVTIGTRVWKHVWSPTYEKTVEHMEKSIDPITRSLVRDNVRFYTFNVIGFINLELTHYEY